MRLQATGFGLQVAAKATAVAALAALAGCMPVIVRSDPQPPPPALQHEEIDTGLETHVHLALPNRALAVAADWPQLAEALAEAFAGSARLDVEATLDTPQGWFQDRLQLSTVDRVRLYAAQNATPYAILCRERVEHIEGWTPLRALYVGLVTVFFVPGETL